MSKQPFNLEKWKAGIKCCCRSRTFNPVTITEQDKHLDVYLSVFGKHTQKYEYQKSGRIWEDGTP
jgi:hypothetical protein